MWESARLLRWLGLTILLIVAAAMPGAAFAHAGPHPDGRAATAAAPFAMASSATAMKAGAIHTSQTFNRCDRDACCEAPGAGCCHSALGAPVATTLAQANCPILTIPGSDPTPKSRKTETRPKPPRVSA